MKNALRWFLISLVCFGCAKKSDVPTSHDPSSFQSANRLVIAPRVEPIPNPSASNGYWFCRPNTLNFGYCFNALVRSKEADPSTPLTIQVQPGSYQLMEGMVILNANQIEVVGVPDAEGNFPELLSANSSIGRLAHQYFSFLVINSSNISIRNLRLNGADILGQRSIGICATPQHTVKDISLEHLSLSRFQGFNIMVGESLTSEHFATIATYVYLPSQPLYPMQQLAKQLVDEGKAYCGGTLANISLTDSEVKMKSVAFYLTPPTAALSKDIVIETPANSSVPEWYAQRAEMAANFRGIEVSNNRFIAENLTDSQYDPKNFHSVMKLHNSTQAKIKNNLIDLSPLQQLNPSRIIVGINAAAGVIDAEIKNNEIKYPAHLRSRFAVNLQMAIEGHVTYGFGDKALFGSVSGVKVEYNSIENGVIRFSDCSVWDTSSNPTDYRPYTQQLNELVRSRQIREKIILAFNSENGQPNRDYNLIWRQGVNEPGWKAGKTAIYCRDSFDVRVVTGNGALR